jgi:hypothetical protein
MENVFNREAPHFYVSNPLVYRDKVLKRICVVILIVVVSRESGYGRILRVTEIRVPGHVNCVCPYCDVYFNTKEDLSAKD